MKRSTVFGLVIFFSVTICIPSYAFAQNSMSLPRWITSVNKLWSQNQISDQEFVNFYNYLLDKKILVIYDTNQTQDLTFQKQLELAKQIASYIDMDNNKITTPKYSSSNVTTFVPMKIRFIYIEPFPNYYNYSNSTISNATEYWMRSDGVKFELVSGSSDALLTVRWVKDTDLPESGYTIGNKIIEVGLGDTKCGVWQPYDQVFVSKVLRHELGHVLGHKHSSDPSDVMYPIINGKKYIPVANTTSLQQGC